MAGKPKPMSQIKQLLRLHQQGSPKKTIARDLGVSKNTVKAYLDKLSRLKTDVDSLLLLDDPVLEARFHPGNPAYKDERFEHFKGKLNYFTSELKRTGVTRKLLWEEYRHGLCPRLQPYSVLPSPVTTFDCFQTINGTAAPGGREAFYRLCRKER